jgi:hypothetical protein
MRRFRARLLSPLCIILAAVVPCAAGADDVSAALSIVEIGAPIRLEIDGMTLVEGPFHGLQGDSLTLQLDGRATTWGLSTVTTVWQSRRSRKRGALIGGAIGAVALGIVAYNAAHTAGCWFECSGWPLEEPSTLDLVTAATAGAVAGFGIGAGVGALVFPKSETWIQTFPKARSPWSVGE